MKQRDESKASVNIIYLDDFALGKKIIPIFVLSMAVLYNIFFVIVLLIWLFRDRLKIFLRFTKLNLKLLIPLTILILILASFGNLFVIETDVDDAIEGAVIAFTEGKNPYQDKVVPHLLPNGTEIKSVYHYFPPDLFTYSAFYLVLNSIPVLGTYWFFISNIILAMVGYLFFRKVIAGNLIQELSQETTQTIEMKLLSVYIIFISPFLLNNATLMVVLFLVGLLFSKRGERIASTTFHVLSASVKYMTGLFLIFWFIEDVKEFFKTRTLNKLYQTLIPYTFGGAVLFILCLPFGVLETIKSVFLYQGNIQERQQVAQIEGPILIEILKFFNIQAIYFPLFISIMMIATLVLVLEFGFFKNTDLYEKQMLLCFLAAFTLPFFGTELFIVPLFAWIINEFTIEF